jgi:hypothetical protein
MECLKNHSVCLSDGKSLRQRKEEICDVPY